MSDTTTCSDISAHQQRVAAFMNGYLSKAGYKALPTKPTLPLCTDLISQGRLIIEEVRELLEACSLDAYDEAALLGYVPPEYTKDVINIEHVAKELADLMVVTTGMACLFGINMAPILEAVDLNNLAKLPEGRLDSHNKLIKPPNHPKPDLKTLLLAQGWGELKPVEGSSDHDKQLQEPGLPSRDQGREGEEQAPSGGSSVGIGRDCSSQDRQ